MAAMSKEHKEALAEGRTQARTVRAYLEALEHGRGPGRPIDRGGLERRIRDIQDKVDAEPNAAKRVELIQKRLDLEIKLADLEEQPDVEALEEEFVGVARAYSERKGISYAAWREIGVPAGVLREAGVTRGSRASSAA